MSAWHSNGMASRSAEAQQQCIAELGVAKEKHREAQEYNELQWLSLAALSNGMA